MSQDDSFCFLLFPIEAEDNRGVGDKSTDTGNVFRENVTISKMHKEKKLQLHLYPIALIENVISISLIFSTFSLQ